MEIAITVATLALAALVFVLYVLFVRWRLRVHRERKARVAGVPLPDERRDPEPDVEPSISPAVAAVLRAEGRDPRHLDPTDARATDDTSGSGTHASQHEPALRLRDAVEGIELHPGLAPLMDARPRPDARDRAVFSTVELDPGAARDAVHTALAAIGYQVTWDGLDAVARRGPTRLHVAVVADPRQAVIDEASGYPGATLGAVVVDFWIPGPPTAPS